MSVHILTFPTAEIRREPDGERWCFICRKRREFLYVVTASVIDPDIPLDEQTGAWYGPTPHMECGTCTTWDGDCFPGSGRYWE